MRAEHEDAHTFLAAHRVLGGRTGVARGRAQDVQSLATPRQFVLEQVTQQLHRHVLEGQRRAIGQGFDVQRADATSKPTHRHDRIAAVGRFGVGAVDQQLQIGLRDVGDEQRQDLERQIGVAQAAPARQRGIVDLGVMRRQVKPAVRRQALEQDFTEIAFGSVAAGADVLHEWLNSEIDSRAPRKAGRWPDPADAVEPALPGHWRRPLGGGAEGASGGVNSALPCGC